MASASQPRIVRRIGEPVGAGGQEPRQRARPEQVLVRVVDALEREQDLGQPAIRGRQQDMTAGLRLEAGSLGEGPLARIEALAHHRPDRSVNEGYWNRRGRLAGRKKDRMHREPPMECALLSRRLAAVKARAGAVNTS